MNKLPGAPQGKPKDLEGWFGALNYFVGLGLIGLGILDFIFNSRIINPISWLYPIYYTYKENTLFNHDSLFGCMILSAQVEIEFIKRNFKFLFQPYGRGIFTL